MRKRTRGLPDIASLLEGGFNEETARFLYAQGEEIAIFVMMQLAALAMKKVDVNDIHPSEPSGSVATYLKPPPKKRRKKPAGREAGSQPHNKKIADFEGHARKFG